LENEELKMQELSERLAGIVKSPDPQVMAEAKNLLEQLYSMNRRWNIPALDQFLKERQRDLFI
jgi:hypothetical protein